MEEKGYANQPLLYIQQPGTASPKAQMQYDYYTPKRQQEKASTETNQTKTRLHDAKPIRRSRIIENEASSEDEKVHVNESEEKQFIDMTLEEKVRYFVEQSKQTPAIKCKISTKDKDYRCLIVDFKNDIVFVKKENRAQIREVSFPEITHIGMLGF